jgi:hypothetical protein
MMPRYEVVLVETEVRRNTYYVEAKNKNEAVFRAKSGEEEASESTYVDMSGESEVESVSRAKTV